MPAYAIAQPALTAAPITPKTEQFLDVVDDLALVAVVTGLLFLSSLLPGTSKNWPGWCTNSGVGAVIGSGVAPRKSCGGVALLLSDSTTAASGAT